ncbi:MAG: zinc transporter ZntB [Desulfuromonas sp.]
MSWPEGVLFCYRFDGRGGARPVEAAAFEEDASPAGPLWLHADYTCAGLSDWLQQRFGLADVVVNALFAADTRPRASRMGQGALVTLRGVNRNPGADPLDMISLRIWVDSQCIITTRRYRLRSVEQVRQALEAGYGPETPGTCLLMLAEQLTWHINEVIDDFEDQMDAFEERSAAAEDVLLGGELAEIRRQAVHVRRYLSAQRDALAHLALAEFGFIDSLGRLGFVELNNTLQRYLEELDLVRERVAICQERLQARLAEQLNGRMYVLNLVAALFLPLTFLTGLLGVNVAGIPAADHPWAFSVFCLLLLILALLLFFLLRRRRWL